MSIVHRLKNNLAVFALRKAYHYYTHYRTDPSQTPYQEEFRQILETGITVIPNFINSEKVEQIREAVYPALVQLRENRYKGKGKGVRFTEEGVFRLESIDQAVPLVKDFFDHPLPTTLAKAYVSPKAVSYKRLAELRTGVGQVSEADWPHMDDWRHRFKAFMYLSSVGENQAPFVYYAGSHRQGWWRLHKEIEHRQYGGGGPILTPPQLEYLMKRYGFQKQVITGEPGTLILFDGRGIHHGTPLRSGERVIMVSYFDRR